MTLANAVPYTPEERILYALAFGERTQSELLDSSGLESYAELERLLAPLIQKGQVTVHFGERCRTYRLGEVKPSAPWWMLPPKPG